MSRYARWFRVLGAALIVVVLALFMAAGGLYFLMRGDPVENSFLNDRLEAGIQQLLGTEYHLEIGKTGIGFDPDGLLSFSSSDVRILRESDDGQVSRLGRIIVGVRFMPLLIGRISINAIIVEDSTLDIGLVPLPISAGIPASVEDFIALLKDQLETGYEKFTDAGFRLIRLANVELESGTPGEAGSRKIVLDELRLRRRGPRLMVDGAVRTDQSNVSIEGEFTTARGQAVGIDLSVEGLNMREVAAEPQGDEGQLGWDSTVSMALSIPFEREKGDPELSLRFEDGDLRIGKRAITDVKDLQLNFKLLPTKNQIELDASTIVAGEFNARLVGGIRPIDQEAGFAGDLELELILDPARRLPTITGEDAVPGSMRIAGKYVRAERLIDLSDILVLAGNDRLVGSASFELTRPTPSFVGAFRSDGLDMAAIKQFWPFFIGSPVRDWFHAHIFGGRVTNVELNAAVRPGVLGRFRSGAKMKPDEFLLTADFEGVRTDTFGNLPPVRDASGKVRLEGMNLTINFDSGVGYVPDAEPVVVDHGSFVVTDIGERPAPTIVSVTLTGPTKSAAMVANSHPLNVFRKFSLDPAKATGTADVDVVAKFPIMPGLTKDDVDWHAIVNLEKAGSSEKVFGRKIENADLVLDATAEQVTVVGEATVDGTRTKLEITEPLDGSSIASSRNYSAVLDNETRERMGLALGTIIDGPIKVSVEQLSEKVQRQRIDLKDAALSLPWIGWQKSKAIPAVATFDMQQTDGRTTLDNFYVEGEGFSAAGALAFDGKGIVSADFADISLNKGDSFALKLNREKGVYVISVSGVRMDARSLINKLFHIGGFGDDQGAANIRLDATLGSVRGFNNRTLNNVTVSYGTVDGWFDNLSMRGTYGGKSYVNVFATTQNEKTTFEVDSTDAGSTLAIVDIYSRMSGGNLHASLARDRGGPFVGPVTAKSFIVVDEPRLERIVSNPSAASAQLERGIDAVQKTLNSVNTKRVNFLEANALIEKGNNSFKINDGVLTGVQVGFTFDGMLYDENNRMDLTGTFLPAQAISRAIGMIPLVGNLLGNGRESGLIGITFRMSGPSRNPKLEVNPISMVAPGVFRRVFEFRN